ncbi:hypothetical protein JKF63_01098 [Porcisia hertigi]|uniref:C3H1-type domain-containing protein n=1 Tax=Porcisia hertigi TaxID=2761500 RepID=A0A836ICB0_9TRYP|nr:hypothetical protein JKF63_01098 [Porcisia hertigi]
MTNQSHVTMPKRNSASGEQHKRTFHAAGDTEEEKRIFAGRYKTKMCKNYVEKGECPYDVRCMFAHGEDELRTINDNIRDGFITEEAIKDFQRHQNQAKRRAAMTAAREHHHHNHSHNRSHPDNMRAARNRSVSGTEKNVSNNEVYRKNHHNNNNLRMRKQQEPVSIPQPHQQQEQQEVQPQSTMTLYYTHNPYIFDLIPSESRLFPVYHDMVEEGCWYEDEPVPAQEDYYFPSSDMMMPLAPSGLTQQYPQYPHQRCGKQLEMVASASSYSGEEAMYSQSDSSPNSAYGPMARCTAADLPSSPDIPMMVMEP